MTGWEEKLFNILVDPVEKSMVERKIEGQLNYYYQRLDNQDLVVAGDVEENYQLLADLGSMYCSQPIVRKERILIKCVSRKK